MKFSTRWIAEYVDLPGELPAAAAEVAARLTAAGLAEEGSEEVGNDTILEIDVTANRPDAMNHYGLARELSAIYGQELRPLPGAGKTGGAAADTAIRLEIADFADCPRYCVFVIRGVKVGPSPAWLADRLQAIGSRSINNVVDVTNYVLWETGQPLHAFDLGKIRGGLLGVRRARAGEMVQTLDKVVRELGPEVMINVDAEGPIGVAGVMGGFDSEVTTDTVDIALESAHFYAPTVRRGAKKLGMHTDASHRFERGADPGACAVAGLRAAALIAEVAGGELAPGLAECYQPLPEWPPQVAISYRALCRFGGAEIPPEDGERILRALGFGVAKAGADGDAWTLTVPTWRYYDFRNAYPADIYEEVLRIWGFDRIPYTLPAIGGADSPMLPSHRMRRLSQDHLAACGLAEAITYAFHDRARDEAYPSLKPQHPPLALANALSDRYAVMRRSLLPNLVEAGRYNQRRGQSAVRLFEIGHIFWAQDGGDNDETETLAMVLGGSVGSPWERAAQLDFFDLKGLVDSLLEALGHQASWRAAELPRLVSGMAAEIVLDGVGVIGFAGQLDEKEPGYPFLVAEIGLGLLPAVPASLLVKAPSAYPGIEVDTTLQHPLRVPWQAIADTITAAAVPDLAYFGLKDRYRGAGVPEGAVNTTITFLYNSATTSLTQEEVNERHQALSAQLLRQHGMPTTENSRGELA